MSQENGRSGHQDQTMTDPRDELRHILCVSRRCQARHMPQLFL